MAENIPTDLVPRHPTTFGQRQIQFSKRVVFPCECKSVDKTQKASDDKMQYIIVITLRNSCCKSSCYIVQAAVLLHRIFTYFSLPSLLLLLFASIVTHLSSYLFHLPSLDILIFAVQIWRFYPCFNAGQNKNYSPHLWHDISPFR